MFPVFGSELKNQLEKTETTEYVKNFISVVN